MVGLRIVVQKALNITQLIVLEQCEQQHHIPLSSVTTQNSDAQIPQFKKYDIFRHM